MSDASSRAKPASLKRQARQSILDDVLGRPTVSQSQDEFYLYCKQSPTAVDAERDFNLVDWWWANQATFPTLFQAARDKLAIPAMSAECERVFGSAKKMITPERNRLGDDIVEACECLKAWWNNGLIG